MKITSTFRSFFACNIPHLSAVFVNFKFKNAHIFNRNMFFSISLLFYLLFGNIGMFLELEYKSKKCILGKMHFCNIPHIFSLKIFQSIKNCFTMDFLGVYWSIKLQKKNKTLCIFYLFCFIACFCYHCNIPHR